MSEIQPRSVYSFDKADASRRDLLGGKGAELAAMTSLGFPVPPGFVITTEVAREYYDTGGWVPQGLWTQVAAGIRELEASTGRGFGDPANPLLVSVRSGAAVSMPGMMDTILNLGINQQVADGIARTSGDERFALDLYRRFLQMFGSVVLGVDGQALAWIVEEEHRRQGVPDDADLNPLELRRTIAAMKAALAEAAGEPVPDDPYVQLERAVRAVFGSWNSRRAVAYRDLHRIPHDLGTAASVVAMVFGNLDDRSGTGVVFTRDPSTGENMLYGEYLSRAQGEDLVSGVTTPQDISSLARAMPDIFRELAETTEALERHYRDVQDVEFTVERGKLYILQTRSAKRGARAAIKNAVDLAAEGLISEREALMRVEPEQIYQLLLPRFDDAAMDAARADDRLLATGVGAAPGAATGQVVFNADTAADLGRKGVSVVLVRPETTAEDVHGMAASSGVLTSRGGATSHAAVVARGLGKPCVTGTESLDVDALGGRFRCGDKEVAEGEQISIDGATGEVFLGAIAAVRPNVDEEGEMSTLLGWADRERRLGVWANADNPTDAAAAVSFGAEGIGLCRTEHMFFDPDRLSLVRRMILLAHRATNDPEARAERSTYYSTLADLEEMQVQDFIGIFEAMGGRPVVVRLLDPPLHEFLPNHTELVAEVAALKGDGNSPLELAEKQELLAAVTEMVETNPMLGLRGCRVGLVFPDIYRMQVRAIVRATLDNAARGLPADPHIMVPLVSHANELRRLRETIEETVRKSVPAGADGSLGFQIGVMIETPRAAVTADEIAESADFFSFGTNDLTQMAFAFSRDDAEGKFLMRYTQEGVLSEDPFQVLDGRGVGKLVEMACALGRRAKPDLTLGICGEHGGDPASVAFFHDAGLEYVSCSPYRVPVARLAAAQAALRSADAATAKPGAA